MKTLFEFATQILPLIACILAIIVLTKQYIETKDKDWLYFIASIGFYIVGEFCINFFDGIINLPIDMLFYFGFYISIFLYLKKKKKGLLNNPSWNNNSQNGLFIFFIVDFFIILLVAFLIFFCFDREDLRVAINYKINLMALSCFIYPVLDFLLLGYYTYLSKNFIMNDKKIYPYLAIGFIIWTIGDLIYAFEAICQNQLYEIGAVIMTISLITFIYVSFKVKTSVGSHDYSTIDLFLNSSKFDHLTIVMTGIIYIYIMIYLYSYMNYKESVSYMDTIETCGVGILFLFTLRYNIINFYSCKKVDELERNANTDPLTGLYTRKYAFNMIESIYKASRHFNMKMSVLMLDIDHFKKYNDTWGHACGDKVLRDITQVIGSSIDTSNIMCRYGGEEILVVMLGIGSSEGMLVAESIRKNVEKYSFYNENLEPIGKVTISIGGATSNDTEDEFELIKKADTALYESKKIRNRCTWAKFDCDQNGKCSK